MESGRGALGYHVVSDGASRPYRVKVSVGSFRNLLALPFLLTGSKLGDMPCNILVFKLLACGGRQIMGSMTPDFRFGNFVGSIIWLLLVVLALVTVLILPIIFFTLFYVPLPVS